MARAVLTLITVGVAIYAIVDCWRSRPDEVRYLPRAVWILTILVFPLMGAIAYLMMGRTTAAGPNGTPPRRVIAPDDDPDFLRSLQVNRRPTREPRLPEPPQPTPPQPKPPQPKPPKTSHPEQPPPADTGDVPADTGGDDDPADGGRA